MAVLLEDPWGGFGPPRRDRGSPGTPGGRPRPRRDDRLFVDTNVIYGTDCRLPLLLLGAVGLLAVHWSPYVAAEVARVATREQALATARSDADTIGPELQRRRHEIDRVIRDHEIYWASPLPAALRDAYELIPPGTVDDEKDVPILAAAMATQSTFLLSTNERDFPNGGAYQHVAFWHPDTFLTAYFEDHPDAYVFVREEMQEAIKKFGAQLRPGP